MKAPPVVAALAGVVETHAAVNELKTSVGELQASVGELKTSVGKVEAAVGELKDTQKDVSIWLRCVAWALLVVAASYGVDLGRKAQRKDEQHQEILDILRRLRPSREQPHATGAGSGGRARPGFSHGSDR